MEPRNSRDVAEDTAYFGSLIAMFILAALSVLLRLYCRWVRGLQLVWDDYTMIGAFVSEHADVFLLGEYANKISASRRPLQSLLGQY